MKQVIECDSRASEQSCDMQPLFPGNLSSSRSPIPRYQLAMRSPFVGTEGNGVEHART